MTLATRLARLTLPASLALAGIGAAVAPVAPAAASSASDLKMVERHLASAQSMTARFVQTDGKGRQLSGNLSLKRPGRIRFEYAGGANMLLVGNGKTLDFVDYEVGQTSSWPIAKSPLAVLLDDNPDIGRIARTLPTGDPRILLVRARDARRPEFGTLILAFVRDGSAPGGLLLQGWTAIDAQNKKTTVKLSGQRYNVAVPEASFRYEAPKARR